ncbi:MAG: hypothetical protein ABF245_14925 [Planktotalea arctica]
MTQTGWQNAKIALLVAALLLGAKLDRDGAHHACAACAPETIVPVLQEDPGIITQDRFKGKDA